jgi:hypothetical protein
LAVKAQGKERRFVNTLPVTKDDPFTCELGGYFEFPKQRQEKFGKGRENVNIKIGALNAYS